MVCAVRLERSDTGNHLIFTSASAGDEPAIPSQLRVLLVEDNELDVELLSELLSEVEGLQMAMYSVRNLRDALAHLRNESYDLVLLDLSLPDSQGLDTFRRLHEQAPHIAFLIMTGLDDHDLGLQAVHSGAQDYLVKGRMPGNALCRAMRYAVERKRAENQA